MRNIIYLKLLMFMLAMLALFGCRSQRSAKPPVHLISNMDNQGKYKAFGSNPLFHDRRNMRPLPEGTVARGHLYADRGYYTGMLVDTGLEVDTQYVSNP